VNEIVFLVEEAAEGGLTARALGESIFTEADDLSALREAVRDAAKCHFDDASLRPKVIRLHYVRDEVMAA
jgi:hypothetical protein